MPVGKKDSSGAGAPSAGTVDSAAQQQWHVRYTEVHGRRYGLRDVAVVNPDEMLLCEGSGGARSWTETVCSFPGSVDDEKHARLIAAAPDLLEALKACAADWKSPPCTVPEGAIYLYREFARRAELAAAAISKATS